MEYSKLKMVTVKGKVEDLPGLYKDLKNAFFAVVNVGADEQGTYLYLEGTERKDPRPVVQAWIGRPPKIHKPTTSLIGRLFRKIW